MISRSSVFNPNKDNWLQFIIASFLVISSVAGFFHYGVLYYILLAFIGVLFLFQPSLSLCIGMPSILFFLFACAISLVVNDTPSYFKAWARLFVYFLMLLVVSPLFTNKYIGLIRSKVFRYCLVTLSFLSIGSFIAYFLGINLFIRNGTEAEIGAGTFSGLMNHSMVLGPFAAISSVFLFGSYLSVKKVSLRILLLMASVVCIGASLLAASRIAVAAGLSSLLLLLIRYYQGRFSKVFMVVIIVVALAASTFPIWSSFTDFLVSKSKSNIELGGMLYSREHKITARLSEFKSSPLFGIGFCTVDPRYDVVQFDNGQIEPGSSWLAIASMTGILGLVAFIRVVIVAFRQAWRIKNKNVSSVLSAILLFYLIHMLAEGYIMAPRSFLAMTFWLLLGTINAEYNKE